MPDEKEERLYLRGSRAAWRQMLRECLVNLGYEDHRESGWILEREGAIAALRDVCESFGDNDWDEDLHLQDIIEKHLAKYLFASQTGLIGQ